MKKLAVKKARRRICAQCGAPILWAVTEAKGLGVRLNREKVDDGEWSLALDNEGAVQKRETARGSVPVVRRVSSGGEYAEHTALHVSSERVPDGRRYEPRPRSAAFEFVGVEQLR